MGNKPLEIPEIRLWLSWKLLEHDVSVIHDPFSFLTAVLPFFSGICFHDLESHFEMAVVKQIDGKQALGDFLRSALPTASFVVRKTEKAFGERDKNMHLGRDSKFTACLLFRRDNWSSEKFKLEGLYDLQEPVDNLRSLLLLEASHPVPGILGKGSRYVSLGHHQSKGWTIAAAVRCTTVSGST